MDAAFGGFIIPFLEPGCRFAFQHPLVTSVSLDAHKTGGMPYPAGVFLCRKGLLEYTKTDAPYIYGHLDHTVPGSRSGAIAAACWATLQDYGWNGYKNIARTCMATRDYLADHLHRVKGLQIYPSRVNLLAAHFPERIDEKLRKRYCIVPDRFPHPLSCQTYNGCGQLIERGIDVYRFAIMPHVTRQKIDQFFKEWNP